MENTIFFILSQIQTALLGQISLDFIAKSVFLIYAFLSLNWPKKGQKKPFWGPRWKNQNVRLQSHQNCGRFGTHLSPVALFVPELRSFSQWPPVVFCCFPKRVSARGPLKRARIAFLLLNSNNQMGKGYTWCTWIIRRIAPSGWTLKSVCPILTPKSPKNGRNGPFLAINGKNWIDGCDGTEISIVLAIGIFRIDS